MRSNIWILLFSIHFLGFASSAQNPAKRPLILQISNGGFVSFKSETSAADNRPLPDSKSLSALIYSQALAGDNRIIHRVLTDAERRVIFGYDLWVNADPVTRKFSLAVLPADEAFRRTFLRDSAPPRASELFATFPKSTKPQTLDDGDAISLELLVNQQSGLKIVDVVRVTFDRSTLRDSYLETPPKDFTLEAVSLSVRNYQLLIDGNLVGRSKSTIGCVGSLLWFYVPDRGRFIFSLVPRDGYSFKKMGVLDGNRIEFIANGEHYEWSSGAPILLNGGTWNLWVLHDKDYTPLFNSEKSIPDAKGPNLFKRLEEIVITDKAGVGLTLRAPGPAKSRSGGDKSPVAPQRVMIGGADSMDNLLPKRPSFPE
jgi:hypothetical protein